MTLSVGNWCDNDATFLVNVVGAMLLANCLAHTYAFEKADYAVEFFCFGLVFHWITLLTVIFVVEVRLLATKALVKHCPFNSKLLLSLS